MDCNIFFAFLRLKSNCNEGARLVLILYRVLLEVGYEISCAAVVNRSNVPVYSIHICMTNLRPTGIVTRTPHEHGLTNNGSSGHCRANVQLPLGKIRGTNTIIIPL